VDLPGDRPDLDPSAEPVRYEVGADFPDLPNAAVIIGDSKRTLSQSLTDPNSVTLLVVFSSWTSTSAEVFPLVNTLLNKLKEVKDGYFAPFAISTESKEDLQEYFKSLADKEKSLMPDFPVCVDDSQGPDSAHDLIFNKFMVPGIPHAFLVGKDGELKWQGNPLDSWQELSPLVKIEVALKVDPQQQVKKSLSVNSLKEAFEQAKKQGNTDLAALDPERIKFKLRMKGEMLINFDFFSTTDSMVVVWKRRRGHQDRFVGKTELINNNRNPNYQTRPEVEFNVFADERLLMEVYEFDKKECALMSGAQLRMLSTAEKDCQLIGVCEIPIAKLLAQKEPYKMPLQFEKNPKRKNGFLLVSARGLKGELIDQEKLMQKIQEHHKLLETARQQVQQMNESKQKELRRRLDKKAKKIAKKEKEAAKKK
jgi:hypothetical protein